MPAEILVPLDGSPLAEQSIPHAVKLAQGLSAQLVLLRAVSVPACVGEGLTKAGLSVAGLMEHMEARANTYLCRVVQRIREAGLSVRYTVERGPAVEVIVDYAGQPDIQLIVMTTPSYSGVRRWMHGSTAESVLQSAGMPVLLVRVQGDEKRISQKATYCQRILVPLDGSPQAEQVLPTTSAIAREFNAKVILLQVPIVYISGSLVGECILPWQGDLQTASQDGQAYLDQVGDHLKQHGINVSTVLQVGAVADSIIEYAEGNHIDLIAMCTHGRTGSGRWTLGRVADRVLRTSSVPLLLMRATQTRTFPAAYSVAPKMAHQPC